MWVSKQLNIRVLPVGVSEDLVLIGMKKRCYVEYF